MASRNMRAGDVASASVVCTRTRTSISTPPGPLGCRVSGDGGSHATLRDTCSEADLDFGHGRDSTLALTLASRGVAVAMWNHVFIAGRLTLI